MDLDFVDICGEKIYFYVQRKKVKNICLRVNEDKNVMVSIPMRMPINMAKEFVIEKISWIKKQQRLYDSVIVKKETINFENGGKLYLLGKQYLIKLFKYSKNSIIINENHIEIYIKEKYFGDSKYIKTFYEKWLKEYAFSIYEECVVKYYEVLKKYNIPFPEIGIRQMKSKWGVCTPKYKKVVFNLSLIKTPMSCVEYVVLHELSHFKYQNHSKKFYEFIEMFMPDWKERKRILNKEFGMVV